MIKILTTSYIILQIIISQTLITCADNQLPIVRINCIIGVDEKNAVYVCEKSSPKTRYTEKTIKLLLDSKEIKTSEQFVILEAEFAISVVLSDVFSVCSWFFNQGVSKAIVITVNNNEAVSYSILKMTAVKRENALSDVSNNKNGV